MINVRKHEQKLKMVDALKNVSNNGNVILSGKQGDKVLGYYSQAVNDVLAGEEDIDD